MSRITSWASHRLFAFVHGRNLIYNTCWEDPRIARIREPITAILAASSVQQLYYDELHGEFWNRFIR